MQLGQSMNNKTQNGQSPTATSEMPGEKAGHHAWSLLTAPLSGWADHLRHPSSLAQQSAPTLTPFKAPAHWPLRPGSEQGNVLLTFSPSWVPTKPHLNARLASCACSVAQPCLTLCDPMDCGPPGSSVQRISQARTLGCIAISFSQGIFPTQGSNPRLLHHLHCRQILYSWATIWPLKQFLFKSPRIQICNKVNRFCWIPQITPKRQESQFPCSAQS